MPYVVKIIADSINPMGHRLTTFELTYPKFIHAEFMTHRMFSRNAQSSRAIPIQRLINQVQVDPVIPIEWGMNQKGMQAEQLISSEAQDEATEHWLKARDAVIQRVEMLQLLGVHKQLANRLLEPWSWITVICTATEYQNFFALRVHKEAQPEIQRLAEMMAELYYESVPTLLRPEEWHLPYITKEENANHSLVECLMASTARCARVSTLNHDGTADWNRDCMLHDRLADNGHWSPFEHQAKATNDSGLYKNFKGWQSYRSSFGAHEVRTFSIDNLRQYQQEKRSNG